jgi:hypothetical protein
VGAAVVGGHDLEILVPRATVSVVVLDAGIRETHVPIVVRQFRLARPAGNLFGLTVRTAVAVLVTAIALVEESLIVALQLVVEDDAPNPTALAAEALLGALVGTIDVGVVRQLAGFSKARVEHLAWLPRAFVSLMPIRFEQVSAAITENDGSIIRTEGGRT